MFRRSEKGQSLVEMALGFVVLLTIVGGIIDIGRWYFVTAAMEDAVGDAALYYAVFPEDENEAVNRAKGPDDTFIGLENSTVTLFCYDVETKEALDCDDAEAGKSVVQVDMYYDFQLMGFVIPEITGIPTITLHSTASQILLTN